MQYLTLKIQCTGPLGVGIFLRGAATRGGLWSKVCVFIGGNDSMRQQGNGH
jgi:hypothetical protein